MAAAVQVEFTNWLNEKLQELNTDETIFGSYIQRILESDDSPDEKTDALQGILSEILENVSNRLLIGRCGLKRSANLVRLQDNDIGKVCNEILDKWQFFKPKESSSANVSTEDMNTKLVKLLESQSLATTKQKQYTEEEKKIREAILSQYSQMTDDEEECEEKPSGEIKETHFEKNTNVQSVLQAEKVKREQARMDSHKKKEKDKEDRLVHSLFGLFM